MQLPWPPELKNHPAGARVCVGDLINSTSSHAAGTGALVMAGLRVRMGINTGVPDDVFLHDVTEHVDYRGIGEAHADCNQPVRFVGFWSTGLVLLHCRS